MEFVFWVFELIIAGCFLCFSGDFIDDALIFAAGEKSLPFFFIFLELVVSYYICYSFIGLEELAFGCFLLIGAAGFFGFDIDAFLAFGCL